MVKYICNRPEAGVGDFGVGETGVGTRIENIPALFNPANVEYDIQRQETNIKIQVTCDE